MGSALLMSKVHCDERTYYTTSGCQQECLDEGSEFCAYNDFSGGICCEDGCSMDAITKANAPLCSSEIEFDLLKSYLCPHDNNCGENKILRATSETDYLTVEPTSAFLSTDHICSYMLTVDNY